MEKKRQCFKDKGVMNYVQKMLIGQIRKALRTWRTLGKTDKISSSEGTRVKLRGRGSENRESRQFSEELFCKIEKLGDT